MCFRQLNVTLAIYTILLIQKHLTFEEFGSGTCFHNEMNSVTVQVPLKKKLFPEFR